MKSLTFKKLHFKKNPFLTDVSTKFNVMLILLFKCTGINKKLYSLYEFLIPPPYFYMKDMIYIQAV